MAKLYFRYGVMGSSKTANALMVRYNYEERGQEALLVKPELDQRDGAKFVASRMGLSHTCIYFSELQAMPEEKVRGYACVIVDEAQFLSRDEVQYLVGVVDDWNVPVICYGLRADFAGQLFPGSQELLAVADIIEEVKTICWCGKRPPTTPVSTSTARCSGRASRWCWAPMTSISACAASTGGRETWAPASPGNDAIPLCSRPGKRPPPPVGAPAGARPETRIGRVPQRDFASGAPASAWAPVLPPNNGIRAL